MGKMSLNLLNICPNAHASIMFGCEDTHILVNNRSNWNTGKCKQSRFSFQKYSGAGRKAISKFGRNVPVKIFEKLITSMDSR